MLSPINSGSGLKAKRKKSLFQSLGATAHKTLAHQKSGIAAFGGQGNMKVFRV